MQGKTLQDFPIAACWKPQNRHVLQLYAYPTPNGLKVSIALEELAVPYEAHCVLLSETRTPAFLSLNPNNKIPAIVDPNGPGSSALGLWESGAILLYLAQRYDGLLPCDEALKYQAVQWVMFQVSGIGPMFGQFEYFTKFAGKAIEDPRPRERFTLEGQRLMQVLENHLGNRQWMMGDEYTIADISIFPWIRSARDYFDAGTAFRFDQAPNTMAWLERCLSRPASAAGLAKLQPAQD